MAATLVILLVLGGVGVGLNLPWHPQRGPRWIGAGLAGVAVVGVVVLLWNRPDAWPEAESGVTNAVVGLLVLSAIAAGFFVVVGTDLPRVGLAGAGCVLAASLIVAIVSHWLIGVATLVLEGIVGWWYLRRLLREASAEVDRRAIGERWLPVAAGTTLVAVVAVSATLSLRMVPVEAAPRRAANGDHVAESDRPVAAELLTVGLLLLVATSLVGGWLIGRESNVDVGSVR